MGAQAAPLMPLELCSYNNSLDKMVIVRCFGSNGFYLERVVFPFEILNFQAPSEAEIEVWCHSIGGPELVSTDSIENLKTAAPPAQASAVLTS